MATLHDYALKYVDYTCFAKEVDIKIAISIIEDLLQKNVTLRVVDLPWEPKYEPIIKLLYTKNRKYPTFVELPNKVRLELPLVLSKIRVMDINGRWLPLFSTTDTQDVYISNRYTNCLLPKDVFILRVPIEKAIPGIFIARRLSPDQIDAQLLLSLTYEGYGNYTIDALQALDIVTRYKVNSKDREYLFYTVCGPNL